MAIGMRRFTGTLIIMIFAVGCGGGSRPEPAPVLNATLWMQQSAEYWALTTQIFASAKEKLVEALADPGWTASLEQGQPYELLPPAVILDVDETALESTTYTAQRMAAGEVYTPETWFAYVEAQDHRPVPGAIDFCNYALSKGVAVVFVTNNRDTLHAAVSASLQAHGFPVNDDNSNVITRSDVRDKGPRRARVGKDYRILLLLGDDGNDFAGDLGRGTREGRAAAVSNYADMWGEKWFMLPNPMYGSWESAILDGESAVNPLEVHQQRLDALDIK